MLNTASQSWVLKEKLNVDARAAGYKAALKECRAAVWQKATHGAKVEKTLGDTLEGYAAQAERGGTRDGDEYESFARWDCG